MPFNPILLCFPIAFIFIIWLGIYLIKKIKVETVSNQDKIISTRISLAGWVALFGGFLVASPYITVLVTQISAFLFKTNPDLGLIGMFLIITATPAGFVIIIISFLMMYISKKKPVSAPENYIPKNLP